MTLETITRTAAGCEQEREDCRLTCVEDTNLAEDRRQVVLIPLTQLPTSPDKNSIILLKLFSC